MKKKFLAIFMAVILCLPVLMLASCGKGKQAATGDFVIPEGGFDTSKEITITFYHTMGANLREVLDKYIVEFNKLYPNIKVEHKQVGSYDDVRDQIKTEITVGNQPNIAYCYPDHVALYNLAKAVVPLDSIINSSVEVKRDDGTTEVLGLSDEQKADFIKGYYDEGAQFGDGKMYSLPMSKSTEVLYYNKTFFDKHGLKVPTTWDEMEKVCEQIKKIDPDSIPLGYDSEANWFITMCEQSGSAYTSATGDHFLFDNDQNRSFVARFREWYQKGYVTTKELSGAYTSDLFKMDPAEKGNSYMCIGSSAGASYQRPAKTGDKYLFEVDITTIPQVNPEKPKVISQGPSLCI
ncbi:MAG: extracellular solute-binding protein, partial [Oscillospiraceae bacterium]|nr:extracellular solute-binding protein [Oscillospiraceae bacterium]